MYYHGFCVEEIMKVTKTCQLNKVNSKHRHWTACVSFWVHFRSFHRHVGPRAHQGNWQPQFPRTVISLSWTDVTEWSSTNCGKGNADYQLRPAYTSSCIRAAVLWLLYCYNEMKAWCAKISITDEIQIRHNCGCLPQFRVTVKMLLTIQ
jgi:hypothetical protein